MPTIASLPARGPVAASHGTSAGIAGIAGRAPPAAAVVTALPFRGFGYVQFSAAAGAAPLVLPPGQWVAVTMPVDPAQTLDTLAGPFAGFAFWDGDHLRARAVGDAYLARLTLTATSPVSSGGVTAQALVAGGTAAVDIDQASLDRPAGTPQVLSFKFALYPKATFIAGGAQILVMSSIPLVVTGNKLVIEPTTAG